MAFTDQERDIARQIKEQGGSREDFLDVLQQVRSQQPEQPIEEPKPILPEEAEQPTAPLLGVDPLESIKEEGARLEEVGETQEIEAEKEEGLKGFVTETGEALSERGPILKQALLAKKDQIDKAREEEGALGAFKEILKATPVGMPFSITKDFLQDKDIPETQIVGQVIAGAGDIIWEGVENLIQDATPESAEEIIEGIVAKVGENRTVQAIAQSYNEFKKNNPERARNIEGIANISQIIPITKTGKVVTEPLSKTAQATTKKTAEQGVKDLSRGLLNIPGKLEPAKELALGKFFAKNVQPAKTFDDISEQFFKVGDDAIKKVDSSLKSSITKHKPAGAKEVLKVIDENLKNIAFSSSQKKTVKELLKKFNNEGLTLTDLNKIKRSINEYTKAWTAAGREAAGLNPSAIRGKYTEIKTFIENAAKKEGLPDIKQLNQDWIQSNELFQLLSKQATSIGKKKGVQALQETGIIRNLGTKIRQLREDLGLSDLPGAQGLEDIDLEKALGTLKTINEASDKVPLIDKISGLIK